MKVTKNKRTREIKLTFRNEDEYYEYIKTALKNKPTGYERCAGGEHYYVNRFGKVLWDYDMGASENDCSYDIANYYSNLELAKLVNKADSLMRRIRRRISELCEPTNWEAYRELKFTIWFNYSTHTLDIAASRENRVLFGLWCDTRENARKIMEEFHDDLIWYFTEYRERMDALQPIPEETDEPEDEEDWED